MKKGSLALSINAIVVIVIAFVVLGLALGLTRNIFSGTEPIITDAFDSTQLDSQPTADNPITIKDTISIGRQKSSTMSIGFYNSGQNTAIGASFDMVGCLETGGTAVSSNLPTIASPKEDIGPSDSRGYKIILTEQGMPAGTYICTIGVKCSDDDCSSVASWTKDNYYETKQFFLTVVA